MGKPPAISKAKPKPSRAERLAEALRANLKRRKQGRSPGTPEPEGDRQAGTPPGADPEG
jgi:hypothetical protein